MSDAPASRLIRGTISLQLAGALGMAMNLLGTVIITRHFSTEVFGTYTLLRVVVSFLSQVSSFGLGLSIVKFISGTEDDGRKQALVSTAMLLRLLATIVFSVAAWIGRPWLSRLFGAELSADLLVFVPLLFLLESSLTLLRAILQGFLLFQRIAVTDLVTNVLSLALTVAVVLFGRTDIVGLLTARALGFFLPCLLAYFLIPIQRSLVLCSDVLKELLKFGFPLQLNDILSFIYLRIDTLVIAALLGPADIAYYEVARKIPDSLRQLYEPFRSVYFAFSSKLFALGDPKKTAKLLNDSARLVACGIFFGAAIALLYGRNIIELVFSAKYLPSAPIFTLLMVNLGIALVGNVMGTSLVTVGEPDKPAIINSFHSVGSLLGSVIFAPVYGATGVALGTMLGTIVAYPPSIVFLRRRVDAKVTSYLKPMAIFCVWAALVLLLKPASMLTKLGAVFVLLLAYVIFSVITKSDLSALVHGSGLASWGPMRKLFPRGDRA